LKGAEILQWDTITEIDGVAIDPEKMYSVPQPVLMIQNNRRMMKRAFLKNGVAGVRHLMATTLKTIEQNIQS
jgi:hypothetical protein